MYSIKGADLIILFFWLGMVCWICILCLVTTRDCIDASRDVHWVNGGSRWWQWQFVACC